MRVNVYAEEMTNRIEVIEKTIDGKKFTGLRFYLELPVSIPISGGDPYTVRGPFKHGPGDDDSSAVTFWSRSSMRSILQQAIDVLDDYHDKRGST